jgi:hypothetical protein
MHVSSIPVASPGHALHRLGRTLTARDLKRHRRILIRDTAIRREREVAGVEARWTAMGLGYAWMVEDTIREELRSGALVPLPLGGRVERGGDIHLAFSDPEFPGRDAVRLAGIIRTRTREACASMSR